MDFENDLLDYLFEPLQSNSHVQHIITTLHFSSSNNCSLLESAFTHSKQLLSFTIKVMF